VWPSVSVAILEQMTFDEKTPPRRTTPKNHTARAGSVELCREAAIQGCPGLLALRHASARSALPVRRSFGKVDEGGKVAAEAPLRRFSVSFDWAAQNRVPLFLLRPVLPKITADRQGTFNQPLNPGLKPWAILCSHFAATFDTSLRDKAHRLICLTTG
jgi:hypothetical protein